MLPARARAHGDLGFKPGDWWINSTFAFRDGIIDSVDMSGSITCDKSKAYAILLSDGDEVSSPSPEKLIYRTDAHDKGRFRLTAATRDSRGPIRILRSHSLHSFWSPLAGIRYEGLYKVTGWSIHTERKTRMTTYDVSLERLPTEPPMEQVLRRPFTSEVEDYLRFKKLRHMAKLEKDEMLKASAIPTPTFLFTTDGGTDVERASSPSSLCNTPSEQMQTHLEDSYALRSAWSAHACVS